MRKFSNHAIISFVKSAIRIGGFLSLLYSIPFGIGVLIVAEIIGIGEEFYEND